MISLLHPSRQRPERSYETCQKWFERAGIKDVQILISTDFDDPKKNLYDENFVRLQMQGFNVAGIRSHNKSAIDAINSAAVHATGDILIVVSDDTSCPHNWAADLLKALEGKKDFVAKCPDGGTQDFIITMPIMDRLFYNRFGYVYHPDYLHLFCDLELACVGDLLKRTIRIPLSFHHDNANTIYHDALRDKTNATWQQGEGLFLARLANNFDLEPDDIVGEITDESYRAWIATKI